MQEQVEQYLSELECCLKEPDALSFWSKWRETFDLLAPVAQDIFTAPASLPYLVRIFSPCGWFTA